jgi:hypothetical protein
MPDWAQPGMKIGTQAMVERAQFAIRPSQFAIFKSGTMLKLTSNK